MEDTISEHFWKAIETWRTSQAHISIVCSQQPDERRMEATVSEVSGFWVMFVETGTGNQLAMNFTGAEIRPHSHERIDARISFVAAWESPNEPLATCEFTELIAFGKPI
jgi:hypothetical protein